MGNTDVCKPLSSGSVPDQRALVSGPGDKGMILPQNLHTNHVTLKAVSLPVTATVALQLSI